MADALIGWEPDHLKALETAVPGLAFNTTGTLKGAYAAFDDTAQEYLNGKFTVPDNINASGTATFRMTGYSATPAASKNVAFDFDHAAVAHDEDLDLAAYTTEASGDKATINNASDNEQHEWTETVTNLGWVAGDTVYFRVSRKAAAANNLVGDWLMGKFNIYIPLS